MCHLFAIPLTGSSMNPARSLGIYSIGQLRLTLPTCLLLLLSNTTSMSAQARRWWQAAGRTTGCTGRDPWAGAWQLLSCTSSCSGWGQGRHTSIFVLCLQKSLSKTLTYQPWARLTNLLKSNVWADSSSSAVWKIGEEVGFYFHISRPLRNLSTAEWQGMTNPRYNS